MMHSLLITWFHFINISDFQEIDSSSGIFCLNQCLQLRIMKLIPEHHVWYETLISLFVSFFILPGHRCVALLPARQVTWREKLQQKVVYFLRRLRSAYGRFFQQNFWLFANWRQELSYTLHILQTPKQTGLVLARGLIRLHKLFSLLF